MIGEKQGNRLQVQGQVYIGPDAERQAAVTASIKVQNPSASVG